VLSHDPGLIGHKSEELIAQRVLALAQGYKILNDHDGLRDDPRLALAGKITPSRLERTPRRLTPKGRSNTIVYDMAASEAFVTADFIRASSLC
jgi:Transposase DDE domain group 1